MQHKADCVRTEDEGLACAGYMETDRQPAECICLYEGPSVDDVDKPGNHKERSATGLGCGAR